MCQPTRKNHDLNNVQVPSPYEECLSICKHGGHLISVAKVILSMHQYPWSNKAVDSGT